MKPNDFAAGIVIGVLLTVIGILGVQTYMREDVAIPENPVQVVSPDTPWDVLVAESETRFPDETAYCREKGYDIYQAANDGCIT